MQNWELMNTAVLTGRQVSQVMKVFIVTQAGKVADVTLQSSCHAEDESVIKVSGCAVSLSLHFIFAVAVTDDEFLIRFQFPATVSNAILAPICCLLPTLFAFVFSLFSLTRSELGLLSFIYNSIKWDFNVTRPKLDEEHQCKLTFNSVSRNLFTEKTNF